MSDRPWGNGLPIPALTLLACGVLVTIAVLAEGPPEQPAPLALYSQPFDEPGNDLRATLLDSIGAGVYALAVGWMVVGITLFRSRRWQTLLRRTCGWAILTVAAATAADWAGAEWIPGSNRRRWRLGRGCRNRMARREFQCDRVHVRLDCRDGYRPCFWTRSPDGDLR